MRGRGPMVSKHKDKTRFWPESKKAFEGMSVFRA